VSPARCLLALSALGATGLAGQRSGSDEWRPRTVPLYGVGYSPEVGLLVGAGLMHTRYAFRALPPSTRLTAAAAYATGARTYRVNFAGEFRRPLAPATVAVDLYASGLEILRFYGLGNASTASGPDSVYQVRQTQFAIAPTVSVPLAARLRFAAGTIVKHAHTHPDSGSLLLAAGPAYGSGDFGTAGARTLLELDTRDHPTTATSGLHLVIAAQWYPALWDAVRPFGSLSAEAVTYASTGDPPRATLALRAGLAGVSGTVPFHELVYIGGGTTLRGYPEQRFAGRSGAYANAELRLRVGWLSVGDVGVLGLADAGRVWGEDDASRRWHAAGGGGLWFAVHHRRASTVSVTWARGSEHPALYVRVGFMF